MTGMAERALRWLYERAPWALSLAPPLAAWEALGRLFPRLPIPPPSAVLAALWGLLRSGLLGQHAARTLLHLALGFVLAVAAGLVVGVLMGRSRPAEYLLDLYLNLFLAAPLAALVPLLILLFGLRATSIVATVFLFAFFVVAVNTYTGVRDADPRLVEMARAFGAPEGLLLRRVILPEALPLILAGIRQAVGRAFNGVILGEMLVSLVGIGGLLMQFGMQFRIDAVLAIVAVIVGASALAIGGLQRLERRLLRWLEP